MSEVRKVRGQKNPLSLAAFRSLREEHAQAILPAQTLAREAIALERKISDVVNEAYGLTPNEVELMWQTAPPARLPILERLGTPQGYPNGDDAFCSYRRMA